MAAYELKYTAEEIDGILESVDEKTIYGDATQSEHGLMSTTDKSKLDSLPSSQQINASLSGKVDKVDGKGLSTNDYDDKAKAKVDAIPQNPQYTDTVYDDTALSGRVSTIEGKESGWDAKQDALVSGTNIKTVNGESLLGGGNIEIQGGGGGGEENVIETVKVNGVALTPDSEKAVDVEVPTKTSDLTNDSGFITGFTETDPTVPSWAKQSTKPSYNYSEIGNTPDISGFITKSVNDLTNYYLKSETYTKAEVAALIGAIQNFHYEFYASTSAVTNPQGNVLYLIGPTGSGSDKYEEYVYKVTRPSGFVKIGDTSIDLSGYVTTSALNTILEDYVATSDLNKTLEDYVATSDLNKTLEDYVTTSVFNKAFGGLATVATSGDYDDLINKPTIPQQEVFWATYGTTTAAEVAAAVAAGKLVMCARIDYIYILHVSSSSAYYFTASIASGITYLYLNKTSNAWSNGGLTAEKIGDKVSTISGYETNTTKYPSTKAVADALGKWGVISQTQTWAADYGSYTLSNVVNGLIPQSFIDRWIFLVTDFGGGFNETSGYFELNGLLDITYKDAIRIVNQYSPFPNSEGWRPNAAAFYGYNKFKARTTIPNNASSQTTYPYLTHNIYVEIVKFSINPSQQFTSFIQYGCHRMKKLLDVIKINSDIDLVYWYALEECYFILSKNFKASSSKYLSLASVVYMVENAINTTAITITLHADALARCTADTTEYTYNNNTYTGIVALANAKNITLASA